MIFRETPLSGAFVIDIEPAADNRGFFARTWCADEFSAHGLATDISQCSVSFNHATSTLRGMHYQNAPHDESKLVSCRAGALYDVIVDLRVDSPSYCQWFGVELSADNHRMLYIPPGLAHGFLTLQPATEVLYQISGRFVPEAARGVRWNDPRFSIDWPAAPQVIADRDAQYPDYQA